MYAALGTVLVGLMGMVAVTALVNILNERGLGPFSLGRCVTNSNDGGPLSFRPVFMLKMLVQAKPQSRSR